MKTNTNAKKEVKKEYQKPVETIRAGDVSASIWKKKIEGKNGEEFDAVSFTLQRVYKNEDGFKNTNNYNVRDINKILAVLSEVSSKYVITSNDDMEEEEDSEDED